VVASGEITVSALDGSNSTTRGHESLLVAMIRRARARARVRKLADPLRSWSGQLTDVGVAWLGADFRVTNLLRTLVGTRRPGRSYCLTRARHRHELIWPSADQAARPICSACLDGQGNEPSISWPVFASAGHWGGLRPRVVHFTVPLRPHL